MTGGTKIRLTIPRQDLSAPSQFHATPEAAAAWAQALPVAHTEPVAQRLATALAELNRVKVSPESRYQILECLRPGLDLALANLHKKYLNQPLVIPREPAATAALAEKLLASACTAYTIVAVQAIRQKDAIRDINPARLACQALQRALVFAGLRVLKAFQLYRPLPIHGWQALHQLYALGESQQLLDLPVQYSRSADTTIRATYLQAIVLGCCKPNKLRQGDLDLIYLALRDLSGLVAIGEQGDGLFVVNLDSDQPPLYSQLLPASPELEIRAIDTGALVERLRAIRVGQQDGEVLPGTLEDLPGHLLDHLIDALGSMSLRNFSRTGTSAALRVCVGLSSAHYHVAGHRDFDTLLQRAGGSPRQGNPFLAPGAASEALQQQRSQQEYIKNEWLPGQVVIGDVERSKDLDEAAGSELLEEVEVQLPLDERYPVHKVVLTDASPGGYCLEWRTDLPQDIQAGEIVSVMEEQGEAWSIAVVRWLNRLENNTLIGLELLSPRALALAATIQHGEGSGPPMRVLLLPEIRLVGQASTLITPRASFKERQRVTLSSGSQSHRAQLTRRISSTASYSQFEFRYVRELGDVLSDEHPDPLEDPYDSLWSNI